MNLESPELQEIKLGDRAGYSATVANFQALNKAIQHNNSQIVELEDIKADKTEVAELSKKIDNVQSGLKTQIKRITLGVDEEALERVLTKILQKKGVI